MKTALVTTTIHVPRALELYLANFAAHGHKDVEVIVIGDKKTPPETGAYLQKLGDSSGYTVSYWDVERQRDWLRELPQLDQMLPYNSVQRRNLGYLQAALSGADYKRATVKVKS